MFTAMVHISKDMWLMFYLLFYISVFFHILFFIKDRVQVNNGWVPAVVCVPQFEKPCYKSH